MNTSEKAVLVEFKELLIATQQRIFDAFDSDEQDAPEHRDDVAKINAAPSMLEAFKVARELSYDIQQAMNTAQKAAAKAGVSYADFRLTEHLPRDGGVWST